jgi:hypothetical protein
VVGRFTRRLGRQGSIGNKCFSTPISCPFK